MTALDQLRYLIVLRWRMVRSTGTRVGLALLGLAFPFAALMAVVIGQQAPEARLLNIALITPTLYLAFAVMAVLAPLAAGGGSELYPPDQLAAYPIRPATSYLASLALAPLNLAWATQVIGLLGATAYLMGGGPGLLRALITCLAYIAATTVAGQTLAWAVVGIRADRRGRIGIWVLVALIGSATLAVVSTGRTLRVLDNSPTTSVLLIAFAGDRGDILRWLAGTGLLLVLAVFCYAVGTRVCDWALRRPRDGSGERATRTVHRRKPARSDLAELRRVDRASVWRSDALRRGLYVLTLLPAGVAFAAELEWSALVLIPGLVAAGAGLLFGVNAFCLDSTGATWLASLPHDPVLAFRSKAWVLAEVCAGSVLVAVLASSLRTAEPPTLTEAAAVLSVSVAAIATVVSTCMRLSVLHPHRADLRGTRETPAPPGAMAVHSVRLAFVTTFLALFIGITTVVQEWWAPALAGLAITAKAGASLLETQRRWADPIIRSRVVATVAAG